MAYRINIAPLSIIVAVDQDGGFGKDGKIPWHFKEDFDHFKEKTKDSVCIMGRKTYEDMLEMVKVRRKKNNKEGEVKEILPGRECYVVTSNKDYKAEGATAVQSITKAVQSLDATDEREVFILGGYRMYVEGLTWANKIYMTVVKDRFDCDVFFPVHATAKFNIADGRETDKLNFITYKR